MAVSKTVVTNFQGYTFVHEIVVSSNEIESTVIVKDNEDKEILKHVGGRPTGR